MRCFLQLSLGPACKVERLDQVFTGRDMLCDMRWRSHLLLFRPLAGKPDVRITELRLYAGAGKDIWKKNLHTALPKGTSVSCNYNIQPYRSWGSACIHLCRNSRLELGTERIRLLTSLGKLYDVVTVQWAGE